MTLFNICPAESVKWQVYRVSLGTSHLNSALFQASVHMASLHYMVLMGVLYLTGALIYTTRMPERFFPGKFDIWFQSHQV